MRKPLASFPVVLQPHGNHRGPRSQRGRPRFEVKNTLHQVLRRVDANGDGYIDKDELFFVLDRVGTFKKTKWSNLRETVDKLLAGLDTNSDGFVDIQEFLDWVLLDKTKACPTTSSLQIKHVFLSAGRLCAEERIALFELEAKENNEILLRAGLGELMDPKRLLLSVGSSSTQAYDAKGLTVSVPTGTKVASDRALRELVEAITRVGESYEQILLINSIGYFLQPDDPVLLELSELARRRPDSAAERFDAMLRKAVELCRCADPNTKRYKFPQLFNDFSLSLTKGCGLPIGALDFHPDIIVDWGGTSYKVFMNGKRIGTEVMDANAFLCEGGTLHRDRGLVQIQSIPI
ncbi:unnamed protein product [Durusdinium trenchii]|uniref:EF-hand domain-containing protein n=2 Tax=Durusdinium trenchii TaxID=1381693 RepID=A0ABP0P0F7_9DINO